MRALALLVLLLAASPATWAEGEPLYPKGKSRQTFEGLSFRLYVPPDHDPEKEYSLIVGLHGADASALEFSTWFEPLVALDFVVCCPKSTGPSWTKPDLDKVKAIVLRLTKALAIGPGRLHGVGFSNGGAHLGSLVMEPKLPFTTACFMGSGFVGGKVPRRARTEMAVLAMAGAEDPALGAAEQTVKRLRGKVRWTELQVEEDLAHDIPRGLMPYYYYWLTVMEGRFVPGEDQSFDWGYDLAPARELMAEEKRGAFVYFYREKDTENEDARHVEHRVFFDPLVRRFGRQLVPVLLDTETDGDLFEELGFTRTPALAVLSPDGKTVKTFEGPMEAKDVARALRSVAKDRSMPRR